MEEALRRARDSKSTLERDRIAVRDCEGLGFWSRVHTRDRVMRIRHDRSSRLPAAVLPNWAQRRRQMTSTGCSIGRGPAV